jgi:hypothetical protein
MVSITTLDETPVSAVEKVEAIIDNSYLFELDGLSNKSGNLTSSGETKSKEIVTDMSAKARASLRDPWYRGDSL